MDELETMREAGGLQHFAGGNETCRIETELRVLAATRRPFARAFAVKAHANADVRFHADFLCRADCLLELFEFLGNDDDLLAELATEQRDADERRVLVAIANDEALRDPGASPAQRPVPVCFRLRDRNEIADRHRQFLRSLRATD